MKHIRNRHLLFADLVLLPLAAYVSFVLRLDRVALGAYAQSYLLLAGLSVLVVPLLFRWSGIYSRYWRFASIDELLLLSYSTVAAVVFVGAVGLVSSELLVEVPAIPRSVPAIFLVLALILVAGPRLVSRLSSQSQPGHLLRRRRTDQARPVLVVGAGESGSAIVRELRKNPHLGMVPVGFIDDDHRKHGIHIHNVPVLGPRSEIPALAATHGIAQVIIAMPTAPGKVIREIVDSCEQVRIKTQTIPGLSEFLGGKVSVAQLRDVQIEDLLRRDPVATDTATVYGLLSGKRVLVTGAGGSIGSELCRQVMGHNPKQLILLGHGENSIFLIEQELRKTLPSGCELTAVIADIRFADRIRTVFEEYRPEVVFHAAAHKHVPLMELNPGEAVTNNVGGTRNLLDAAMAFDVERFVMISSDKAVNPTNVMGTCKRVGELLVHQAAKATGRPYMAVRFGNVLGSRGSVVLTFKQQIAAGGPITVTDPEMRRYFMTIPEAVQLVLQAGTLGRGGEVFVLDMGQPIKISDLARDMIELSGLELGRDIDIVYTGLRPGEKLYEELFIKGENYCRTEHHKIFIAQNASSFVPGRLDQLIASLQHAAEYGDREAIFNGLKRLVPEYRPSGSQAPVEKHETHRVKQGERVLLERVAVSA